MSKFLSDQGRSGRTASAGPESNRSWPDDQHCLDISDTYTFEMVQSNDSWVETTLFVNMY